MRIATARSLFFVAAAIAALSLTGGASAKGIQGSGIVGSVTVVGHKVNCKPVTETQCTADSHGALHNCHEVSTTECTVLDISRGNPSSPFRSLGTAPLRLSRAPLGASTSGPAFPRPHFAALTSRASTLRPR